MNVKHLFICGSILIGAMIYSRPAAALQQKYVPAGSISFVGTVSGFAKLVSKTPAGACSSQSLGTGSLSDDTLIWGTSSNEQMYAVTSTMSFCGFTMTSVSLGTKKLTFYGVEGDDRLYGFTKAATWGGAGNDILRSEVPNSSVLGEYQNDVVITTSESVYKLSGGDHNDALCVLEPAIAVERLEGGTGTDSRCGAADEISSIESVDCAACQLLF